MAARALLLIALIAFLFPMIACADDAPTLPSRKASVVIPLLKQISAKEPPKEILADIHKILGAPDPPPPIQEPRIVGMDIASYRLDDGTDIVVICVNGKPAQVGLCRGGGLLKSFYATAAAP